MAMNDVEIRERIEKLEAEEQQLRVEEQQAAGAGRDEVLTPDRGRLAEIRVELDQLWDLLRQRKALRDAGRDPEDAELRPPGTVEGYLG